MRHDFRQRLVASLRDAGALTDERWIDVFRTVPRHSFLPRFFVPGEPGWGTMARGDDGWLTRGYSTNVLVTQLDDDSSRWEAARSGGPLQGTPTSSSSMPAIMAIMLEELLVSDGQRILEIGTGTGYNAALLCQRLGASNVTTVDIDPALVKSAIRSLAQCGFAPRARFPMGCKGLRATLRSTGCCARVRCRPSRRLGWSKPCRAG